MKTRGQWLGFWVISLTLILSISGSLATRPMSEGHVARRADAHEAPHPAHVAKENTGATGKKAESDPAPKAAAAAAASAAPSTSVCGNGILEKGEECDCGSDANCAKDPCCDRKTCKLTPGSVCSNSQSCCDKCQFRPSTFVCRAATPSCSLVQMCSGLTPTCPTAKNTCHENEHRVTNASLDGLPAQDEEGEAAKDQVSGDSTLERDAQCRAQSTETAPLAGACPEANGLCQMYCLQDVAGNSTSAGAGTCTQLASTFSDGTPCGDGGTCASGKCQGDKSAGSFFQKYATLLTIIGASLGGLFVLCGFGIFGYRRWQHKRTGGYQYGGRRKKEKERKIDIFPMVQTNNGKSRPRSNVRIGLDPMEPREYYDHLSYRHQDSMPSGSRPPKYAPDALKTDQELREDLEADGELGWSVSGGDRRGSDGIIQHYHHHAVSPPRPSLHASPPPLPSHVPLIPTSSKPLSSDPLQMSSISKTPPHTSGSRDNPPVVPPSSLKSKDAVYSPPPLPPADTRSGAASKRHSVSPYADDAMLVLPPASPPIQVVITTGRKNSNPNVPPAPANMAMPAPPTITVPPTLEGLHIPKAGLDDEDDEPSLLQLNPSSLMVDESSRRQDRTSVSSFFSALQLEPDPVSPMSASPYTPTSPTFSSSGGAGNGVPLSPATALAIHLVTTPTTPTSKHFMSSSSSVSSQSTESMDEHSDSTVSMSEPMEPSLSSSSYASSATISSHVSSRSPNAHGNRNISENATTNESSPKMVQGSTKPYQTSEYVIPTPVARRKPPQVPLPKVTPNSAPPAPTMPPPPPPTSRTPRQANPSPLNVRRQAQGQQHSTAKELANDLGFELVDP